MTEREREKFNKLQDFFIGFRIVKFKKCGCNRKMFDHDGTTRERANIKIYKVNVQRIHLRLNQEFGVNMSVEGCVVSKMRI